MKPSILKSVVFFSINIFVIGFTSQSQAFYNCETASKNSFDLPQIQISIYEATRTRPYTAVSLVKNTDTEQIPYAFVCTSTSTSSGTGTGTGTGKVFTCLEDDGSGNLPATTGPNNIQLTFELNKKGADVSALINSVKLDFSNIQLSCGK